LGLPAERAARFASRLTDAGLAELGEMLDTGRYRLEDAEEAALPVVAWLSRSGDRDGALALLEEIGPFAGRLRLAPAVSGHAAPDPEVVYREIAGEVRSALLRRVPNEHIEAMREALTVWNPFTDELLIFWSGPQDAQWLDRARDLLAHTNGSPPKIPAAASTVTPRATLACSSPRSAGW
jgi:hypothetical protein